MADLVTWIETVTEAFGPPGVISNAKIVQSSISILVNVSSAYVDPRPVHGHYAAVMDMAELYFENGQGAKTSMAIPAPVRGIFLGPPSMDVINKDHPAVAALVTALQGALKDTAGRPIDWFRGGFRGWASRRRR